MIHLTIICRITNRRELPTCRLLFTAHSCWHNRLMVAPQPYRSGISRSRSPISLAHNIFNPYSSFLLLLYFCLICFAEVVLCEENWKRNHDQGDGIAFSTIDSLKYWVIKSGRPCVVWDIGGGNGAPVYNAIKSSLQDDPAGVNHFVLIEKDLEKINKLREKIAKEESFVIINMEPQHSIFDHLSFSSVNLAQVCYSDAALGSTDNCRKLTLHSPYYFFATYGHCPTVIILHVDDGSNSGASFTQALFSLSKLIDTCQPTVYFLNMHSSFSHLSTDFMVQHGYSHESLLWKVYPATLTDDDAYHANDAPGSMERSSLFVDLIAVGSNVPAQIRSDAISNHGYVQLQPNKYYITEYPELIDLLILHSSVFTAWSPSCPDGGMPPCIKYTNQVFQYTQSSRIDFFPLESSDVFLIDDVDLQPSIEVLVDISDLIAIKGSFTINLTFFRDVYVQPYLNAYPSLQNRSFTFDMKLPSDAIKGLANFYCLTWIKEFIFSIFPNKVVYGLFDAQQKSFNEDFARGFFSLAYVYDSFQEQCASFVSERAKFIQRTRRNVLRVDYDNRRKKFNFGINKNADLSCNNNDINKNHEEEVVKKEKMFHPLVNVPFQNRFDINHCFEPVFCNHTFEFYNRLVAWQNPRGSLKFNSGGEGGNQNPATIVSDNIYDTKYFKKSSTTTTDAAISCKDSKFLIFEPMSAFHGIGSMLNQIITVLKIAIENDRILVLEHPAAEEKTLKKWRIFGCETSIFECVFQPVSHCYLTNEEFINAEESINGMTLSKYFHRNQRVIRYKIAETYPISFSYNSEWKGSQTIWNGLLVDHYKENPKSILTYKHHYDRKMMKMTHFSAFLSSAKFTWASTMMRYLFRPQKWFYRALQDIVATTLIGPQGDSVESIPRPFASLHVRYGAKRLETPIMNLSRYMKAIQKKKHIKNVFISTETESVIDILRSSYPSYNFYHLKYERIEVLDLKLGIENNDPQQQFSHELLYSMANLFASVEADAFVGTLTSNWCMVINYLQRSRGDAGFDYLSVDGGSHYSTPYLM